jgi:aminomethyltransferase
VTASPPTPIEDQPLKKTALHGVHLELGGRMVPYAGWSMPVQYAGVAEEHRAVRSAAGLFDVCHMGELELSGDEALAIVDSLVTNNVKKLVDGQALYTCCCNEGGTILDDLIIYRADATHFLVVCNAANLDKIRAHFEAAAAGKCDFRDRSEATALLALQGPKALEILGLAGADAAACQELGSFRFRDAIVGNVACTVARTGYTGEDGVEIFCATADAEALFRSLLELGRPLGLLPAGLACRDTLRLEARLSLYGNDIDETTTPLEAGLGWVVKLDGDDFVGKDALVAQKAAGLTRTLVGFEVLGRGIARHGYPLEDAEGNVIGTCTSGSPGPTVGKNIGLGYLPIALAAVGSRFFVDCRGKKVEAEVVKTPFYRRPKPTTP